VGFLNFYGDVFDPRTTGISVINSEYFLRPSQTTGARRGYLPDLDRRHSFRLAPVSHLSPSSSEIGKPFSFDPVFIEDPLSSSNNVGRNSFRINQVQRAFSDASASLTAALEWDMNSGSTGNDLHESSKYPLLKCLVQNGDL
jgi:hypothetical protein